MKICYIDEAGCTGQLPTSNSDIQPTLTIIGMIIDASRLSDMTNNLLHLKKRFFPNAVQDKRKHLGWMLQEIKGSDLRKDACDTSRNKRRHALGYITGIIGICEANDAKLVGRVWIKGVGAPIDGIAIYSSSIQCIYADFQRYLTDCDDFGFVIADSRMPHLNTKIAHSIFTQKFKNGGDAYSRIVELPAFSHSVNHAGLQVADTICSAILTPIAVQTYCSPHLASVHIRPGYKLLKEMYAPASLTLQYRYSGDDQRSRGGLIVADGLSHRPGGDMFR